ncbi:hypothetical protein LTR91_009311 [Friedmanniomyces endolithicus]|uniref:ADF-H domain-containing protein n=1 Tax=Friedmanniomyces endolithicus TaxID=329885 RepID=A0AAN6QTZ0_9PEZI|nr:hypothetical protein LTS00_009007 [Friedmanniomyces endolithicus]KAK0326159.1 hypothetical protein LTR82_002904 [Friedmanniomyces endolithicus]KAK0925588.1 hypothetical protein LTR57_004889 [Friedmanniomyces endolithicus]KAK0989158.1 hypothetical protein LTR91_009311 [Friedmanniomyces endolithicus]KAK1006061.1 hypothetical protein LTS01_003137 [Friedmanniomyces endolithicus]
MSLNGLDTPDVREAYQRTIVEAGGWFLLRYTSRDSVQLLDQGKGGVHEARTAIAKYEEASPLYGLLIYRRRKVLIKFIPEGTSRLLQARTAVHFQDVMERYSPYETMLEITTAESLNDTSLASSFPLHTASPATSSNRLHEISEDGEDHGVTSKRPTASHSYSAAGAMFGTQRYKTEKRVDQLMTGERARRPTPSIQVTGDTGPSPQTAPQIPPVISSPKASLSQYLVRDESGQRSITSLGSQPSVSSATDYAGSDVSGKSAESAATTSEPPEATHVHPPRESSRPNFVERPAERPVENSIINHNHTTERMNGELPERSVESPTMAETPNLSEMVNRKADEQPYDFSMFDPKPKVKLGPRPVATGERTKRQVASIAAIPANFRPVQKKSEPSRQQPYAPVSAVPLIAMSSLPRPPPIPNTPEYNPRPVSRGSVKSLPSHKSTNMTPDKMRLMKAVELRKKQLRKSNPQPETALASLKDEDAPAVPAIPKTLESSKKEDAPAVSAMPDRLEVQRKDEARKEVERDTEPEAYMEVAQHTTSKKPDSGIEMDYEGLEKRRSAQEPHVEKPRPPAADEATLAQLQPPPRKPGNASYQSFEPTVSLDMLEDTSARTGAIMDHSFGRRQPDTGLPATLSTAASKQPQTSQLPLSTILSYARPVSPNLHQSQIGGATSQRAEASPVSPEDIVASGTLEPPASPRRNNSDLAKRRRGIVEPLHIDSHAEGDIGSDDELLEELQAATVHQAKPVIMARSPMAQSFSRRPSAQSMGSDKSPSVRSINIRRSTERFEGSSDTSSPPPMPAMPSAHARSQSVFTTSHGGSDAALELKRNMSNGVTKRMQALAEAGSRESSSNTPPRVPSPDASSAATWRERKSSVRSPIRSRENSYKAAARQSGRLSGWGGQQSNVSQQAESTPTWSVQHDPTTTRDSVSVTARIVRPNTTAGADDFAAADGYFQQPQLMINHKRASASRQSSSNSNKALPPLNIEPYQPKSETPSLAVSPTLTRASSDMRTLHSANRKSLGRYKQAISPMTPSAEDFPAPPMQMTNSNISAGSLNDDNPASRDAGSRTSRFLKRISNLGATGKDRRRSGAQQSLAGSSNAASTVDVGRSGSVYHDRSDMPPSVVVGDLNVQFPDSLLWKRRIVEIDDAGYLLFSIPQALDVQKGAVKRFHLSEFRKPCAPDLDRQELPHSVLLDFADGETTLQAACEDAMTSRQVMFVLVSYWRAWSGVA